jgi:hypothetical protein
MVNSTTSFRRRTADSIADMLYESIFEMARHIGVIPWERARFDLRALS